MAPKVHKISGHEMEIVTKDLINSKTKIKSTMITAKSTAKNLREGKNAVSSLNYDEVKQFIEDNKELFFKSKRKAQINVFTPNGWRAGRMFSPDQKIDWFSVVDAYKGEEFEITEVFAIQILHFE